MKFQIEKATDDQRLIMRDDGRTLAGSIVRVSDAVWRVEIMWTGPTGDITYEALSLAAAMAFVDGIGVAAEVFGDLREMPLAWAGTG